MEHCKNIDYGFKYQWSKIKKKSQIVHCRLFWDDKNIKILFTRGALLYHGFL